MVHARNCRGSKNREAGADRLPWVIEDCVQVWTRRASGTTETLVCAIHDEEGPVRERHHAWHNTIRWLMIERCQNCQYQTEVAKHTHHSLNEPLGVRNLWLNRRAVIQCNSLSSRTTTRHHRDRIRIRCILGQQDSRAFHWVIPPRSRFVDDTGNVR